MLMPLMILIMFIVAPGLGLVLSQPRKELGEIGSGILLAYLIHSLIIGIVVYYMTVKSRRKWKDSDTAPPSSTPILESVFVRGALMMIISAALVFALGGYKIMFGGMHKGEVRTSLGGIGFLYAWLLRYLCPSLITYLSLLYKASPDRKANTRIFILCFILAVFAGLMTGTKFATVMLLLPAMSVLIGARGFAKLVSAGFAGAALIVVASMMHEGRSFKEAVTYSGARATVIAAYGARSCWAGFAEHPAGLEGFADSATLLGGNKIASASTGIPEQDIRFLKFNPARYITYLYYPTTDEAVDGTTNLTLTNFGEAVYYSGKHWFWVWSLASALILGMALNWYTYFYFKGRYLAAALVLTYYFTCLIYWLSSGDWVALLGLPTIVGYVLLRFVYDMFQPFPMVGKAKHALPD